MSSIRPLGDRVIVRRQEEQTTAGGIVIPDTASEKSMIGEVIAVGPGKVTEQGNVVELSLKVGDKVLFGKYAGTEIEHKGEQLAVMREDDILGVIEG